VHSKVVVLSFCDLVMIATTEVLMTGSLCPSSPSCASGCSVRSFLPDQLLLMVRHIQRGVVDSSSRNTRGCLKQKVGVPVGQEVAADADTTEGCEEQEVSADADAKRGDKEMKLEKHSEKYWWLT
jgi:hypothetical protein